MRQQEGEDSEQFYQELQEEELATLKKHVRSRKGTRGARNNSKTDHLYKEALMDSIFGRFKEASGKLKHMITLTPDTPEPYHLLGTMHEENGELDKAAQYLFMSTYLSPPNLEKWLKVGDLSFEQKMYTQAAYCYGRALKIASCDPKIMVKRAEAFELGGQSKKAIATYKRLLGISQAPEYVKNYAKLRYRRGEFSSCRQILKTLNNFMVDSELIYMACETYLQQRSYQEAATLLQQHLQLRQETMQENEALLPQFIVVLLICSIALKRDCYNLSSDTLLQQSKQCFQDEYAELYSEAVNHISKFNEAVTFSLVKFLLKYPQHQTVTNYLLVTNFLCKQKDETCLEILEQALKNHPHSPELLAQRDYIYNSFGIGATLRDPDAIFYSDEDDPLPVVSYQRKTVNEPTDAHVMERLIQNVEEALRRVAQQINKGNSPGAKEQQTVMDGLQLFISLAPNNREQQVEEKEGLYIKKMGKKRGNEGESRISLINDNIDIVIRYFESLVLYLKGLLSHKQWRKLIQVGEKVSKVHVFKNHSKLTDFTSLKIQIYEMCVLSCLAANKFNTALFFQRYLVTKHPLDVLYVLATHLLMRICPKKTFLSSALSKRLGSPGGEHLAKLLAAEYMETGCFDLAISALLRSNKAENSPSSTVQLCLAACLIQIASSRNTYNKLDFTNRSALCLASYQRTTENSAEGLFNKGRWYAQVKLNHKAIASFEKLLASEADDRIKQRAAYCLICIYRECDQFQKADKLSQEYFALPESQEMEQDAEGKVTAE